MASEADLLLDPVAFVRGALGHKVWKKQAEMLRSVRDHKQTAVKACHGSSKTFTAAEITLWWLARYSDGIVVTTAPTWFQVENLLWQEIHKALEKSRVAFPKPLTTELTLSPGNYAIGLSTNETVRFQGFHGDHVLFIIDEAPGVRPGIWEAISGAQSGGDVRILALGNPTLTGNPFHSAFTKERHAWNLITIDAFDTPNLQGISEAQLMTMGEDELADNRVPFLVTRDWVKKRHKAWGPANALYQARVRGNFPDQAEDNLYSLQWIDQAAAMGAVTDDTPYRAGVDVAGPGEDETVLCVRQGANIVLLEAYASSDPRGEVAARLLPYKESKNGLENVNVDSIGIGYYFAQHLRDLAFNVSEVNVGTPASDTEKYANLKAEMYWGFRQRLLDGDVHGLTDETAIGQLASIKYKHNARGQILIESKEEARKRGISSPDRAEGILLAFGDNGRAYNFY